jgi:hypothetical protein
MEENNFKKYFNNYIYLSKNFLKNYDNILINFKILKKYVDNNELIEYFINDINDIFNNLNNNNYNYNDLNVEIPNNLKHIKHYMNIYHYFIININLQKDNNDLFNNYLQFMKISIDIIYYYINNEKDKLALLLLIYIPIYGIFSFDK